MQLKDLVPEISWPWSHKDAAEPAKSSDVAASEPRDEHPLTALQREMNRAFDSFWRGGESPFGAALAGGLSARADVVETDRAIEVSMELPGMEEKDLDVSLTREALTIRGEKKIERQEEKKGVYLSERSYGALHRAVPLPAGVDVDNAEARFRNGVLTVTVPKLADAKTQARKIEVSAV